MHDFLSFFHVSNPGDVTWSHAVNSQEKLARILSDDSVMMIESDILLSSTGEIIAAHPPVTTSDLLFEALLSSIQSSKKGFKIDFKDPNAVEPVLELLKKSQFVNPLILNADILQGNHAPSSKFDPQHFLPQVQNISPTALLSLGWTTIPDRSFPYTKENITEMEILLTQNTKFITFPVRICYLARSFDLFQNLLKNDLYTLSLWNNESITQEEIKFIKTYTDPKKTFYDCIDENWESIRL